MYNIKKKLEVINIYGRNFGNKSKVCKDCQIDRDTFYEWLEDLEIIKDNKTFKQLLDEKDNEFLDTGDQLVKQKAILEKNDSMLKFYMGRRHPDYKKENINVNLNTQDKVEQERNKINELFNIAKQLSPIATTNNNQESSNQDISG